MRARRTRRSAISKLSVGKTYHFRIVATSDAGTTTGSDATFTTSSAPVAVTADASPVAVTTATLRGQVTPNGLATTWWFEYGTSVSYGQKTASHSAGSGTTARAVSDGVTKLTAGKSYHFRLVAQNSSGRVFGLDRLFTTVGAPTATTGAAQSVGPDTAQLTGSLDTLGRSTTWWFDYGTTTKYGKSTTHRSAGSKAGAQTVTAPLTGLAANTAYHYRLVAKSDGGTRYGADATFSTSGVSLVLAARQVVFGGRVQLTGTVPTHTAGEQVVIFSKPYGIASARSVATVLTGANGVWTYLARPQIATAYQASWRSGLSAAVSVAVHPRVTITRYKNGHFFIARLGRARFPAPRRAAAAEGRDALGDDQARAARSAVARRVPGDDPEGTLDGPRRIQRQPGRCRLPRRHEPRADVHALVTRATDRGRQGRLQGRALFLS